MEILFLSYNLILCKYDFIIIYKFLFEFIILQENTNYKGNWRKQGNRP